MQQNYINPESSSLPDITAVKRKLEFNNYQFNQQQLQRREEILKRQKLYEIQQSALANEQAIIEMENQKLAQLHKKIQAQQTLKRQYDRQIYARQRIKTEEKSYDKIYSEKEKQLLQNYERSRIHDMAKIYNISDRKPDIKTKYLQKRNLLTEGCEDSLDNFKHQSQQFMRTKDIAINTPTKLQSFEPRQKLELNQMPQASFNQSPSLNQFPQTQSLKMQQKPSLSSIQHPSLQNSRSKKYSAANLQYSDYLKRQIQRKQKAKQQQKRKELEKDRTWVQKQTKSYHDTLQQINYNKLKRKWEYASGLDKQLSWKKQNQFGL